MILMCHKTRHNGNVRPIARDGKLRPGYNWECPVPVISLQRRAVSFALFSFCLAPVCLPTQAQGPGATLSPARAAGLTELPVGPWGPYARGHSGPCYVLNRLQSNSLAFPIVIGQVRREAMTRPAKSASGKSRLHSETVLVERRAMGLSGVHAERDDRDAENPDGNRRAVVREADAEGLFWRFKTEFAPAKLSQPVLSLPAANGKPIASGLWGAGEATVEYFPAYVDPDADGLIIRVTLANRSSAVEEYVVDLLAGMNSISDDLFPSQQLSVQVDDDSGDVVIQHTRSQYAFALAAKAGPTEGTSRTRSARVSDNFFSPAAAIQAIDALGAPVPFGELPPDTLKINARGHAEDASYRSEEGAPAGKSGKGGKKTTVKPEFGEGLWGLKRVSSLSVPPGGTVTLYLAVGTGKRIEDAQKSAHTLLDQAGNVDADNKTTVEPAYAGAVEAHRAAAYAGGATALDGLVAQSLVNVPLARLRRVGCPSKQSLSGLQAGTYDPGAGGMIALGWSLYRPDWSAAQLNAWFLLTVVKPDQPAKDPIGVAPTNLMALWDLYQRTHDKDLIARLYPYARRRYLELLAAGRTNENEWLFSWTPDTTAKPLPAGANTLKARFNAPDYSAYIIRSARILTAIAKITLQSPNDMLDYTRDAAEAGRALNEHLWDKTGNRYIARSADATVEDMRSGRLADLLPLIAGRGALSGERRAALIKSLTDPNAFWSAGGLRSRSSASQDYRGDVKGQGAVVFEENWMLWKALFDLGEMETAGKLATNLLHAYEKAVLESGGYPECLDGVTQGARGAADYSGDALALLPMYAAYHVPGTVSTGWDVNVTVHQYDKVADKLHVELHALAEGKATIVCALGKPHGTYALTGANTAQATADATGAIVVTLPGGAEEMAIDIVPTGASASIR